MNDGNASLERILKLVDNGSFVEIGAKVTFRSTDFPSSLSEADGDGVRTGYGLVGGKPVYVYSQDASVLGGSVGEMHARKIADLYRRAVSTGQPVIGIIDSCGLRLEEVTDGLNGYAEIFRAKAEASGIVPEIDLIFGNAGGAMAIAASLSDFVLMEEAKGALFLHAPNTVDDVKPGGIDVSKAKFASEEAGTVDFAGTEDEIIGKCRTLIGLLPCNYEEDAMEECSDDLNRLTPELSGETDVRLIAEAISDRGSFTELKASYEPSVMTAFSKFDGVTAAVIGSALPTLTPGGLEKMAAFVRFADAYSIPILSFVKGEGFSAAVEDEKRLLRSASSFVSSLSGATVPKIEVLLGNPTGAAYLVMGSKALGMDYVFALQNTKIRVMAPESAAKILGGEDLTEVARRFDEKQSVLQAAKRGYVDEIIDETELRKKVLMALEMLFTKRTKAPERKHASK
ncbi:MAG: carboxyl transferase [Lachnospiraceae bacterium]|nr:carboxyl transferase [Lachnospiraceae bacterium]